MLTFDVENDWGKTITSLDGLNLQGPAQLIKRPTIRFQNSCRFGKHVFESSRQGFEHGLSSS